MPEGSNLTELSLIAEVLPPLEEHEVEPAAGLPQEDIEVLKTRIVGAKCDRNYLRCDSGYSSAL